MLHLVDMKDMDSYSTEELNKPVQLRALKSCFRLLALDAYVLKGSKEQIRFDMLEAEVKLLLKELLKEHPAAHVLYVSSGPAYDCMCRRWASNTDTGHKYGHLSY